MGSIERLWNGYRTRAVTAAATLARLETNLIANRPPSVCLGYPQMP
jgi:hypothetical protein